MQAGKVTIRQVHKAYGAFKALDGISLDIHPGEFMTLLGPSGSGKTTLLNVIAGFERPDQGSLLIDDAEFITRPPHKRDLGMVFQNYALFPHMNVFDNVGYPLRLRKVAAATLKQKVMAALETVHMAHLSERGIHQLSGGQKQRVALARAIVFEPKILLMDEPLSALDKNLREQMQIELKRLHRRLGMTTVYVTHDQQEALTMSDRVAILKDGKIVQLDTPKAIYDRPNCKFVAGFMGETSFLPVNAHGAGYVLDGQALRALEAPRERDGEAWLMVRPERLRWRGREGHDNRIDGKVIDVVYQGGSNLVSVSLPDNLEIGIRHTAGDDFPLPEVGRDLCLWLAPEATVIVGNAAR